ncbi:hemolysin family protein [Aeromicrobium sp.]|uniref:hemolysin family protein n=1 Tax=Aeromicrobium sp. TaxID=1871063 RepID=UPI0019B0E88F|nr:hemolysin family protein [Aeromicrobium sp.]MBC7632833.1 HlyC/CorC family transporter [Aeromicrobium sp.]
MSEYVPGLVWLVVLLAANAFFVGAEFAVISARRSQIEPRAAEGSRAAKTTLWAMEHATLMLATSQLGITICSLLILNVSEPAIHHLLEYPLGLTPLTADVISVLAFVVALLLVTYLHVVLGEMVPKNLAFSVPDRAALILAPPLVLVSRVFKPIIWVLNGMANGVLRLFGVEPKDEATSTYTLEQVAGIVEQSHREGTLTQSGPLAGAFEFTDRTAGDIEVALGDIVLLPAAATPADVQRAVVDHGHSRHVLADDDGEPVGYVHMKDVMELEGDEFTRPLPAKRVRRLIAIPRSAELEDALARMRQHGSHVARSVDEAGTTLGLLFLEDAIEVLVGEIHDATAT